MGIEGFKMTIEEQDELVDKKHRLIRELNEVLDQLLTERVDILCDAEIRAAVLHHPALELK